MFKWAAGKELIDPAVPLALRSLAGLKKGRTNARETNGVSCVDDAIVDATVPHLPEVVADMVRLQRLTGARPGEVCSLRPCDLDRSSDVWLYSPCQHKTEHHEKGRIIDAILIDDIGYVQQSREEMEVLFTLLAERYERGSVMLTSNLPFSKWEAIFKDPMTTAAAIDRLVHHSVILELNISSYRLEKAQQSKPTKKSALDIPGREQG